MVMERAARIAAAASQSSTDEENEKIGMRLAAEYLKNGGGESLLGQLQEKKQETRMAILKGITDILLRNIVLPRDAMLRETGELALRALAEIGPDETAPTCKELHQILNQYNQHKEQMRQQLEDAIRSQLEQKMAQQGRDSGKGISINPAMHPQYQEEMGRMLSGLNQQYNQALDQRKAMLREILLPES